MKRIGICGTGLMGATMAQIYEQGCYGVKNGRGFYDYSHGKGEEAVKIRNRKFKDMKDCLDKWEEY